MPAKYFGLAFVAALAMTGSASAQPADRPPPGCKAWNADLPPVWMPWAETPSALKAAASRADLAQAGIASGKKFSLTLAPSKAVRMIVETPDIDPPADAHGGMLSLRVPSDGYYWVAVSQGLWIDVVANGVVLESTDHGPGPNCASIGKTVQFQLKAGDAIIQLSDNKGAHVDLMVTRQP